MNRWAPLGDCGARKREASTAIRARLTIEYDLDSERVDQDTQEHEFLDWIEGNVTLLDLLECKRQGIEIHLEAKLEIIP